MAAQKEVSAEELAFALIANGKGDRPPQLDATTSPAHVVPTHFSVACIPENS